MKSVADVVPTATSGFASQGAKVGGSFPQPVIREVGFSQSAAEGLSSQTVRAGPLETGGVLIGRWSSEGFLVTAASGPGPRFAASRIHFVPDHEFQRKFVRDAESADPEAFYVGHWHKHPARYPRPSEVDTSMMRDILRREPRLDSLLCIITTLRHGRAAAHAFLFVPEGVPRRLVSLSFLPQTLSSTRMS